MSQDEGKENTRASQLKKTIILMLSMMVTYISDDGESNDDGDVTDEEA